MDLDTQTDRRLRAAGITEDDPGLVRLRQWNALAYARRDHGRATSGVDRASRSHRGGGGIDSPVAAHPRASSQPAAVIPFDCGCPPGAGYCSRRKRWH